MTVGLFVPCYIDQFYPDVAVATLEILEKHELDVVYPESQTCCGQPMANSGCQQDAAPLARRFLDLFVDFDYVVAPSGSCVSMVKHHYDAYLGDAERFVELKEKTFELCEFLTDILRVKTIDASFPHRVGLHESCHGLRELRLAQSSERVEPPFSKTRQLLEMVGDIQLTSLERQDECCGFGGTFSVNEEAVSCMMGMDRIADHETAGTEVITAADMSCLMHLGGLLRRQKHPIQVLHIAQILAGGRTPRKVG